MTLRLHTDSPEVYLAENQPLELAQAIHDLAEWDDLACRVADYLFNAWTLTLCMRTNDREGLDDLEYALSLALDREQPALPAHWRPRWEGYRDLARNRARLYGGDTEIKELLDRKHVREVLGYLAAAQGEALQTDLRKDRGLSHERLSQVLRQLEGRGLISRRRQGRENWVAITSLGREFVPEASASSLNTDSASHRPGRTGMCTPLRLSDELENWREAA